MIAADPNIADLYGNRTPPADFWHTALLYRSYMFGIPLHLLAVHFPIALTVLALVYDARRSHAVGYALTLWAAAGAAVAGATGLLLASERAATKGAIAHAGLGLIGTIVLIALAMLR